MWHQSNPTHLNLIPELILHKDQSKSASRCDEVDDNAKQDCYIRPQTASAMHNTLDCVPYLGSRLADDTALQVASFCQGANEPREDSQYTKLQDKTYEMAASHPALVIDKHFRSCLGA